MIGTATRKTKLSKVKRIKSRGHGKYYIGWSESEWVRFEQTFRGGEEDGQIDMCGKSIPSRGNSNSKDRVAWHVHVTAGRPECRTE